MNFMKYVKWRGEKFGAVIFDTLSEKVYVTNETGRDVLGLIGEGMDAEAIAKNMGEAHEGEASQIESDVCEFVASLQSAGLVASQAEGQQ